MSSNSIQSTGTKPSHTPQGNPVSLRARSISASVAADLDTALKRYFGHERFMPLQREAVGAVLSGADVFINLATGAGKSLCFQLPAALRDRGLSVVVSPLTALMNDQVMALLRKNIWAVRLHSQMTTDEKSSAMLKLATGRVRLLYVSPELFATTSFHDLLEKKKVQVNNIVVDEGHCVSMWGHDFRVDYQQIPRVREKLGNPQLIVLTATAPVKVRDDVLEMLRIPDAAQIIGDISRSNLRLSAEKYKTHQLAEEALITRLKALQARGGSGIVYFRRIRDLEEMAEVVKREKIDAISYHGRIPGDYRATIEKMFMSNQCRLVLATKALGMGIDKPDIDEVIHFGPPDSLEESWQEDGRAGRDGRVAQCTLIYTDIMFKELAKRLRFGAPKPEMINQILNSLERWIPKAQRDHATPQVRFTRRAFFSYYEKKSEGLLDMATNAFAALVDFGVLQQEGDLITLRYPGKRMGDSGFPVTETLLDLRYQAQVHKLKVMLHYAEAEDKEAVIREHFTQNSVAERVQDSQVTAPTSVGDDTVRIILSALARRYYGLRFAVSLTNEAAPDSRNPDPHAGVLKHFNLIEVGYFLEALEMGGYIRRVTASTQTRWALTESGAARLRELGEKPTAITSYEELLQRCHTPEGYRKLCAVVGQFIRDEIEGIDPYNSEDVNLFVETLKEEKFEFYGEGVTGLQLIAAHYGKPQKSLTRATVLDFVRFIAPEIAILPQETEQVDEEDMSRSSPIQASS